MLCVFRGIWVLIAFRVEGDLGHPRMEVELLAIELYISANGKQTQRLVGPIWQCPNRRFRGKIRGRSGVDPGPILEGPY